MKWLLNVVWLFLCLSLGIGIVYFYTAEKTNLRISQNQLCQHQLSPGQCAFCDTSLIESLGFCHGHGVPEAFCTRCNPSLIKAFQVEGDWCAEHNLPESQCKLCKEETTAQGVEIQGGRLKLFQRSGYKSGRASNPDCSNDGLMIALRDPKTASAVELGFAKPRPSAGAEYSLCNVEIEFDQNHLAHITPRGGGTVVKVQKDLGDTVQKGTIMARIHSDAFAQAKSEYLQAKALYQLWRRNFSMEQELQKSGATSARSVLEAETKMIENRVAVDKGNQQLRILGLSKKRIESLTSEDTIQSVLEVTAPFQGIVIQRHAVFGETVDQKHALFMIANTKLMWARLDVASSQVRQISYGDQVEIIIPELSPMTFQGKISWLANEIDDHTRTLKARVVLTNDKGLLKAGMFGQAKVHHKLDSESVMVPRDAVHWDGCCNVLFLKESKTRFETRKVEVRPSERMPGYYSLKTPISMDREIVTTGSFLLKTELMKGDIGAGCCEVKPGG
ncbi:efflux RND transporter periplasmic adaptor subunit [bacterium]|nr:efflux RND transporter periplasmic adaptor subunit [bacterium]